MTIFDVFLVMVGLVVFYIDALCNLYTGLEVAEALGYICCYNFTLL